MQYCMTAYRPIPPNKETMNSASAIATSPHNKGIFKIMEKSRHLCEPTPQALAKTILPRNRQSNQIRFASMYKLRLDLLGRCPAGLEVNPLKIQRCSSPLQPDRVPTHSHKPFPNQQSQSNKICFYRNQDISASQHHRP